MENIKEYEVNGQSVWVGKLYKIKGKRQEKPVNFHVRPLNIYDVEAMSDLSKTIYQNLREGEECFIHKHTKEYYYDAVKERRKRYIGVFVGDNLVGMSSLTICENRQELEDELPNSKYDLFNSLRSKNTKVASLGSDSVLPDFRGNSLNTIMINYRLKEAERLGCTDCTSIVDRNNRWNMLPYFTCRFNLFCTAIDPSDNGKISLLHKPIDRLTVLSNLKERVSVSYNSLENIDNLINKGYVGIEFDKKDAHIIFAHSSYYRDNFLGFYNCYKYKKAR